MLDAEVASTPSSVAAVGPGRVLALSYAFFTLAAGARSGVQLATKAGTAPLAYSLSAVAALVYLVGTVVIAAADRWPGHRRWARRLCATELAGVLAVGAVSWLAPGLFPDATVWSQFGAGYGYVPAILPVLALLWLRYCDGGGPAQRGPMSSSSS